jgi:hypothetical protein
LPIDGKKSTGVISKAMPSVNKGSMGILFGKSTHIHTGKHLGVSTFLSMLSFRSEFKKERRKTQFVAVLVQGLAAHV